MPTELPAEDEEAKRFDLLMLRIELTVLRAEPGQVSPAGPEALFSGDEVKRIVHVLRDVRARAA